MEYNFYFLMESKIYAAKQIVHEAENDNASDLKSYLSVKKVIKLIW